MKNKILVLLLSVLFTGCSDNAYDQLDPAPTGVPSGSIIISSNVNGTTGPGLISVWTPEGELDRVVYDYTKVVTGYASGTAFVAPNLIFAVSDTGGSASNDFLDLFDYTVPFANPTSLFTTLSSGGAGTYTRQMALVTDTAANRYYAFVAESGNNRVARLSSVIASTATGLNFTRDYNFSNNGTCVLTSPYGVAHITSNGYLAVIQSSATGRVNIFDQVGNCIGSTSMTNFPTDAAYHSLSDKVLVTYATNSSIMAHNPLTGAASPATAIYTSVGQLSTPRAIATDAQGNIYVASHGLDHVVKLHWDGVSASATYVGTIIQSSTFTQNITSITVVP